tara:strand:- start:1662 stop:2153 length:492 start_codon:yes stop_codon:yes gene_type:complete
MILIAHRGNTNGISNKENDPVYIHDALKQDFDVEIDVWYVDKQFWLGHGRPQYEIDENFLENPRLWCHAKNIEALYKMNLNSLIHCFWHQKDDVTLTSRGYVWTYPGKELTLKSICVLPESISQMDWIQCGYGPGLDGILGKCAGICSNDLTIYREALKNVRV